MKKCPKLKKRAQAAKKMSSSDIFAVIFLGIFIILCLGHIGESLEPQSKVYDGSLIGREIQLKTDFGAVSEEALDKYLEYVYAKDFPGHAGMIMSGYVLEFPRGTNARVLSVYFTKAKVRLLEGEHAGRVCWVLIEAVK